MAEVVSIPLDSIRVQRERQEISPEGLSTLAESIKEEGLIDPIVVRPLNGDNRYEVVAGRRRIQAHRILGVPTIEARVEPYSEMEARLVEIDENLQRQDLTILERAEATTLRMELRERLGWATKPEPIVSHGGKQSPAKRGRPKSAARAAIQETAAATGVSEQTVRRDAKIGTIARAARTHLRKTPHADNQKTLTTIAALPPEKQVRVSAMLAKNPKAKVSQVVAKVEADAAGSRRQWPPELEFAFGEFRQEVMEVMGQFSAAKERVIRLLKSRSAVEGNHLQQLVGIDAEIEGKWNALAYLIREWVMPKGPCPSCDGVGKPCDSCKGDGWAPESRLRGASPEKGKKLPRWA